MAPSSRFLRDTPLCATLIGVALATATALLLPCALTAQAWSGEAGVGVRAADDRGQPLEGARVELGLRGRDGAVGGGPPPVTTDARGRAEVRGLAEGEWVLTVRHPDTMAYVATLRVRQGRRPRERSASQVKVGDSLEPMRVRYFEASGPADYPAPAPPPAEEAPPPPEPEPERVRERRPEPPPEPPPGVGEPEVAPEAEQEPVPPTEPVPEPETAPEVEPVPEPQPVSEPEPESAPSEEPAAARAPEPAPAPRPRRGTEPPVRGTLRSFEDGTCVECPPGEWAVSSSGEVAPGPDGCPGDLEDRVGRAAALLGSSRALGRWAGPIHLEPGGPTQVLGDAAYREMATSLGPMMSHGASGCWLAAVMLPEGAELVGFRYEVEHEGAWLQCLPASECPGASRSRWVAGPLMERTPAGMVVAGAYVHPEGPSRRVRLTVYFDPPGNWNPR